MAYDAFGVAEAIRLHIARHGAITSLPFASIRTLHRNRGIFRNVLSDRAVAWANLDVYRLWLIAGSRSQR